LAREFTANRVPARRTFSPLVTALPPPALLTVYRAK